MTDYQRIDVPEEIPELSKLMIQIDAAKKEIAKFDYIGIKIAMGISTIEDYTEEIEYTESIRTVIREIEEEIEEVQNGEN